MTQKLLSYVGEVKRAATCISLGLCCVLTSQACGSEDGKKSSRPDKEYTGAGEGGASSDGGGSANDGGTSSRPDGGTPGEAGAIGSGDAGSPGGGTSGTAGTAGTSGASGAGGDPGDGCEAGKAECDGNPLTVCEQALNLVTSCGACDVTCKSTNGSVICNEETLECEVTGCNTGFGSCDGDDSNGCETNLVSNASNCGACGRDCAALGSTCLVDRCDKITLQTSYIAGANSWAFAPSGVYHLSGYPYSVKRLPLDGATPVTVWAPVNKTGGLESLLVLGSDVIWAERGAGGTSFTSLVLKKSISAAAATLPTVLFTPEYQPTFMRVQGNAYYWMSGDYQSGDPGGYVYTRSLTSTDVNDPGTRIVTLDQGTHGAVLAFQATSDALYWVTLSATNGKANELRTTGLNGGTPVAVPPVVGGGTETRVNSGYGVPVLQVIGDTLYFNRNVDDSFLNGIYSYKKGDEAPTQIVSAENVNTMLVDDEYVYYAMQNVAGIFKAPLSAGGAGVQITDGGWTRIIGEEGKFLYGYGYGVSNMFKIIK
jgi:hypothetical protein